MNDFPEKEDVLRYVLCAIAPENKDADFTWKDFQARNNNELVSILGNFINRVIVLTNKYWDGEVPKRNLTTKEDDIILNKIAELPNKIGESIENYKFREGLYQLIDLARLGNKYLAEQEPWKLFKINLERTETVLNICLQIVFSLSVLSKPFLPETSNKICKILNFSFESWNCSKKTDNLKPKHKIEKAKHLFSIISDEKIQEQIDKLN